jgi:hypothetical protein
MRSHFRSPSIFIHNYAFNAKQQKYFCFRQYILTFIHIDSLLFLSCMLLLLLLKSKERKRNDFLMKHIREILKKKSDKGEKKERTTTKKKYKIATKETAKKFIHITKL